MPSFQFYFEFNNLKDKDFSLCIMCLGQDISLVDLINIILFVHIMIVLVYYYKQLHSYVDSKMQDVGLNSIGLTGEMVNVHFISHARVDKFQHLYNWQIVKMLGYKNIVITWSFLWCPWFLILHCVVSMIKLNNHEKVIKFAWPIFWTLPLLWTTFVTTFCMLLSIATRDIMFKL